MTSKDYNKVSIGGSEGNTRCKMPKIMVALLMGSLVAIVGCKENETSFFIEHVKMQPSLPECQVSESDGFIEK